MLYRKAVPVNEVLRQEHNGKDPSIKEVEIENEAEKIKGKVMTVDELVSDFAKKNQDLIANEFSAHPGVPGELAKISI